MNFIRLISTVLQEKKSYSLVFTSSVTIQVDKKKYPECGLGTQEKNGKEIPEECEVLKRRPSNTL